MEQKKTTCFVNKRKQTQGPRNISRTIFDPPGLVETCPGVPELDWVSGGCVTPVGQVEVEACEGHEDSMYRGLKKQVGGVVSARLIH